MKKTSAAVLMIAGGAVLGSSAYDYTGRYSPQMIFQRQVPAIERFVKKPDAKSQKYSELKTALTSLAGESDEKRCRFEKLFQATVVSGGTVDSVAKVIENKDFEPYAECKPDNRMTKEAMRWYNLTSALAVLVGAIGMAAALFKREDKSTLGPGGAKKREEIEAERRRSLADYGFSANDVKTIITDSMKHQSVNDIAYCSHTTAGILRLLEGYGFSNAEVQRIVLTYPQVLDRAPETISAKLKELEQNGRKRPAEVMQTVLRLPASLG